MSNNISALRTTLFDTLQAVKSDEMDIDRARAVSDIAQTIINTAKAEIDYAKATGAAVHSSLIETSPDLPRLAGKPVVEATSHGTRTVTTLPNGATVTRHKAS